jgi:hypothetical protein
LKKQFLFLLYLLIFEGCISWGQIGGKTSFNFLTLSPNTRTAGLGGLNVSLTQNDVNSFLNNPALLDSSLNYNAALNYTSFYTGIPHTSLVYAHPFGHLGTLGMGLQYINYGTIQETDDAGNVLGTFSVNEFALSATKSVQSNNFRAGATLKFVGSQMGSYNAFAFSMDIGGAFIHPIQDLVIGLALKNIGFPLKSYTQNQKIKLPFDAQLGVSFKPQFMPFRFSLTAHHLYEWDISYNDPNIFSLDPLSGTKTQESVSFGDNLFRHFVLGTELILHKNFQLRFGYNRLTNRELRIKDTNSWAGVSAGLAFKVKSFEFAYTRASYHVAGGRNYISISKNIASWIGK